MSLVSVIVPCYNEAETIALLLDAIRAQTIPQADIEVLIVDGRSTDATRDRIHNWRRAHPELDVKILDNPARAIPHALNIGIEAARGEFLIRLDAHCVPNSDYFERCLIQLRDGVADNVGGRWDIQPGGESWAARSIAVAASSPIAVGDAKYRYSEKAEYVDTVPFGSYRTAYLREMGGFDESLLSNEDYDLNVRIRRAGGKIWLDPSIRSVYFARSSFGALAKQYFRYGYWKVGMLRKDPRSIRLRQLAPPLLVLTVTVLLLLSFFSSRALTMLLLIAIFYLGSLFFVSIRAAGEKDDLRLLIGMPIATCVMHFCWGFGFLLHLFQLILKKLQAGLQTLRDKKF